MASNDESCFINGSFVRGNGAKETIVNPFSEEVLCHLHGGSESDVNAAVQAAKDALPGWKALGGAGRAKFLIAIAEEVAKNKDELSALETKDCGKPLPESEWDLDDVSACLKHYAKLAQDLDERQGQKVDVGDEDFDCHMKYEPAGVVGLIVPFNYPLLMATWKLNSLAAGCTAILKPSEHTPLTALALAKICEKVGLPKGVLNIVTGASATGEYIVKHPDVKAVAFTGSVPTGIKVAMACAPQVKQVGLELGGKSPAIIFDDCDPKDLNKICEWTAFGCWWTNGQICSATSRLLVHESIAETVVSKLKKIASSIKMGDPMDPDCRLGPLISSNQRDKVLRFISKGVEQGAKLVQGSGKKPNMKGFFVEPTILQIDSTDNVCWTEEIFGPVLTVRTFKTDEEALELANGSRFGLAAAVFTSSKERLAHFNNELQVGIVWNSCSQPCFSQLPWGGPKMSGVGRDLGMSLDKFLEPKQIVKYVSKEPLGWYDVSKL